MWLEHSIVIGDEQQYDKIDFLIVSINLAISGETKQGQLGIGLEYIDHGGAIMRKIWANHKIRLHIEPK